MANTTGLVLNDTTLSPVSNIIPEEERQRFASISTKNLQTFSQYTDSLCSKLSIKGVPWKTLTSLNVACSELDDRERDQCVKLFTIETKLKSWKTQISQFTHQIDEFKREIEYLISTSSELSLEVDAFQKKQKSKHGAYMQALHYYKSHLNLYINIEDNVPGIANIRICFFTSRLSDIYMIILCKNNSNKIWDFVEANPKLPDEQFAALRTRLRETNDISNFLVTIQKIFTIMKKQNIP